jgi:hypothetical protein
MKKAIITVTQFACVVFLISTYNGLIESLPVPIKLAKENPVVMEIKKDLTNLGASQKKIPEFANAIYTSHQATGINPKLITALMKTESNFNKDALGPQNRTSIRYKGLMQTPSMSGFVDADVLHGVRILEQKLKSTNYDVRKALALYKGGDNDVGRKQADTVLALYHKLQKD